MLTGRMRRQCLLVAQLLIVMSASFPALAEKRVALVIGNSAYVKAATLPNPKNDAMAIAGLFRKAGFDVVDVKTDLGADGMRRALRDFSEQVRDADMAIVFYAGHGMEMNGVNYLIPVDATLARDVDVEDEAVSVERVIRTIEPARRLQLVILDACRDNPFVRSMRRTFVSRSLLSGHGDIDEKALPPNTLIAYAQKAGLTAEDGVGVDSPYTTALLKHLATPGLDIELALRRVRDEVLKATRNRQEPFKYGSLGGAELPLVPAAASPPAPPPSSAPATPQKSSEAAEAWAAAKDMNSIPALEDFIARYKGTYFAYLAQLRLEELRKQQVAVAVQPPTASQPVQPHVAVPFRPAPMRPPPCRQEPGLVEVAVGSVRLCLKANESFKDCPNCPEMVLVPAGQFMMGSPSDEPLRASNEGPQHKVTFAKAFAVGRFSVTFDEWDACLADHSCRDYRPDDRGWGRWRFPAIHVSWDDAKAYVSWLSKRTGKPYRLLSEAEREYVTRAGTKTPFWWGTQISTSQANYGSEIVTYPRDAGQLGGWRGRTMPVDSFKPNPWGLYQVHGNTLDWVEDCYHENYVGAPADGSAWTTGDCNVRVLRGGSWVTVPELLRSASRESSHAEGRDMDFAASEYSGVLGFRVARTLTP